MDRSCGTCTKCCEGHLSGVVRGIPFSPGKPCHFVKINAGCSIYEDRPDKPCKRFKCMWLTELDFPEWLKPNLSNVMFVPSKIDSHDYIYALESGSELDTKTLSWAVSYMWSRRLNFAWQYRGEWSAIGSDEFVEAHSRQSKIWVNEMNEIGK